MHAIGPFVLIGVTVLSGCAPHGVPIKPAGAEEPNRDRTSYVVSPTGAAVFRSTAGETVEHFGKGPRELWPALVASFDKLGVPVFEVEPSKMVITAGAERVKYVGGKSISDFISCNRTTDNTAASGRVQAQFESRVVPYSDGTAEIRTMVTAVAVPAMSKPSRCTSTGGIEQMIHNGVHAILGDTIRR